MRNGWRLTVALCLPAALAAAGGEEEGAAAATEAAMAASAEVQAAIDSGTWVWATLADYEQDTGNRLTSFGEAPMLAALVAAGELPPVEERHLRGTAGDQPVRRDRHLRRHPAYRVAGTRLQRLHAGPGAGGGDPDRQPRSRLAARERALRLQGLGDFRRRPDVHHVPAPRRQVVGRAPAHRRGRGVLGRVLLASRLRRLGSEQLRSGCVGGEGR